MVLKFLNLLISGFRISSEGFKRIPALKERHDRELIAKKSSSNRETFSRNHRYYLKLQRALPLIPFRRVDRNNEIRAKKNLKKNSTKAGVNKE